MKPLNSRYFEELEVGEVFITPSRTITETDVLGYAGLSGDFEELHVSKEFAKDTIFKERVAHGLLGLVIFDGLKTRTSLITNVQTTASLGWTWDFKMPLCFGDTVTGKLTITSKRITSRGDQGILFIKAELINQDGKVIQIGENKLMVMCKPKS